MRLWIDTAALGTAGQAVQAKVGEMKARVNQQVLIKRNKSSQTSSETPNWKSSEEKEAEELTGNIHISQPTRHPFLENLRQGVQAI